MSVAQADYAITRLYEDESLRGELTDDEANLLLGWSEAQCQAVAAQEPSDPVFEAWTAAFKRLLVSLNRFIGKRGNMPPHEQQAVLSGIGIVAEAAGYEIAPQQLENYLRHHGEWPNDHALSELVGLMKPLPVSVMAPVPPAEPAAEPVTEPAAELAAVEPTSEPAAAEPAAEPIVEPPAAELPAEPVTEPAAELIVEPPAAEPAIELVTEPAAELIVEPPAAEPPAEPSSTEPAAEPSTEITPQEGTS